MPVRYFVFLVLLLAVGRGGAQNVERMFMQVALRTTDDMVIDGNLTEPAWQKTPGAEMAVRKHADCHQTITKLLWDDKGMYVGVICYQDNLDTLKAQIISRDGGYVWADDSSELFFSPRLSAINYYKIDINSRGVFGDWYKEDASQDHYDYNAIEAQCASGRLPGAWTIEFFISWRDMDHKVEPGSFVGFQQSRFEWNGAELRASYLTGGSYFRVILSYVYLAGQTPPSGIDLARKLDDLVATPWFVASDPDTWFFSDKQEVVAAAPTKLVDIMAEKVCASFDSLDGATREDTPDTMRRSLQTLEQAFEKVPENTDPAARLVAYSQLLAKTKRFAAELELDAMLSDQ